jgi:2-dehydro-3-deoxygluconokinase
MEKIVGYGELMLRLTPENDDFLVTFSEKLLSTYGGSEANSLSFLGRRGYDCEFLSSFPNNELGNKAISFLKTHGVKVNANIDKHRLGKYFVIPGTNNKLSKIIYDRKNSSFSKFKLNDSIIKKALDNCSYLIISGITPPLSDVCYNNILKLIEKAKNNDIKIVYDINYRKDLWSKDECKNFNLKILSHIDILFTNSNTFNYVFDINSKLKLDGFYDESEETLKNILCLNNIPTICMTVRNKNQIGGLIFKDKKINKSEVYDIDHVDRVGAGDSFTGAVLYGFLKGWSDDKIISFATTSFAISHTKFGDVNCFNDNEIERFKINNSITDA